MARCHHTSVQTHRTPSTKSERYCKLWTLVDNDVNVGSSAVRNVPPWCEMVIWWEAVPLLGGGEGNYGNSPYFPLNSSVNLNLL